MADALDKLGKTNSGSEAKPTESSKKINKAKRQLNYLCQKLVLDSNQYKPERTVDSIEKYITDNPIGRILYSEISSFIVGLNESQRATVSANLDTLVSYVLDSDVGLDVQKISIKLYDHFQLNLIQIENAKSASDKAIAESIVDEKEKLHKEVKGVEKEYITILGIFAAIMLAFVGGFTFSTSVLNNIGNADTNKLALIALIIGLVFVLLLTVLISFLREINEKTRDKNGKRIIHWASVIAIAVLTILIVVSIIGQTVSKMNLSVKDSVQIQVESKTPETKECGSENESE